MVAFGQKAELNWVSNSGLVADIQCTNRYSDLRKGRDGQHMGLMNWSSGITSSR
jgi:hypothetical protein